jgi:hypothetical protein
MFTICPKTKSLQDYGVQFIVTIDKYSNTTIT